MGIKLGMTWRVALFLMCLIEITISTIDVKRYCLEIMSIWQYEGLVCHGQIPLFSLSSCVPGTWLCLGLKLIEDCSSAGLLEWPFQNKFFIGEINI